eukprot:scaffold111429_cov18-Tisochrysis_lutea.AAC.1
MNHALGTRALLSICPWAPQCFQIARVQAFFELITQKMLEVCSEEETAVLSSEVCVGPSVQNNVRADGSSGAIGIHVPTASVYAPENIPNHLRANFSPQTIAQINLSVPNANGIASTSVMRTGPLAVDPNRLEEIDVVASQRNPEAPLPFLRTSIQQCINLEMCLFPHCYPHGTGSFNGRDDGNNYHLHNYHEYRMKCAFTLFTLYSPYLLLSYQIQQCHQMAANYSCQALEGDIASFKKRFPEASEDQVYESVAKCKVPGEFAGSPSW